MGQRPHDIGTADAIEAVADELRGRGAEVATIECDVRRENECAALIDRTLERFGSVDIFVNNAGIGYLMKPLLDTEEADWDAVIGVNLSGAFFGTKHTARAMIAGKRGGGRIINIASQAAKSGFPHMAPYCSSKHGMIGLTRSTAIELGPHGITVNAVCLNHVTTGLGEKQNAYFAELLGFDTVDSYLANMTAKNPLGRPAGRGKRGGGRMHMACIRGRDVCDRRRD